MLNNILVLIMIGMGNLPISCFFPLSSLFDYLAWFHLSVFHPLLLLTLCRPSQIKILFPLTPLPFCLFITGILVLIISNSRTSLEHWKEFKISFLMVFLIFSFYAFYPSSLFVLHLYSSWIGWFPSLFIFSIGHLMPSFH